MKYKLILLAAVLFTLLFIAIVPSRAQSEPNLSQPVVGVMLLPDAVSDATDGALKVIDYGFFRWALFPVAARQAQTEENVFDFSLVFGEEAIDMSQSTINSRQVAATVRDFYLVQLIGPTKGEWRDKLEATGVEVVQYIHPFTYVVYGDRQAVGTANSAEFIRWSSHFLSDYRQPPQTDTQRNSAEPRTYRVVIYRGADRSVIDQGLTSIKAESAEFQPLNATWAATNVTMSQESADELAQTPGIFTIQPLATDGGLRGEMSNQMLVRALNGSNIVQPGYQAWLTSVGVDGTGVTVANVDNGIYDTHPDLVNRMASCTGSTCGGAAHGSNSHGTHTAGIIAADASSGTTLNGFLRGLGVAPGASLVEQLYSPTFTQANGMLTLMRQSVQNGAVISANSWGPSASAAGYDNDTLQVDIGVRDADATTPGNQPLNYILSFMNGFGGFEEQGTPDEAKNIFTIGSTNMQNAGTATQRSTIFDLSANTAHGPALDGRTIPHMVAPGCYVDSTFINNNYGTLCGTSMASPHISGGAALFFEKYRNDFAADPSPALVKAAFTAVADTLAGNKDADGGTLGQPFDSKQGWGFFNLTNVISPTHPVIYLDQTTLFTETGQTHTLNLEAAVPNEPIRIMLAWTDAPGHGLGGRTDAWNNNLDLFAYYNGDTYAGNQFDANGWSIASNVFDDKNNTEGIFFETLGISETISLVIAATNINSDGVPNNGIAVDQDFALACYNCAIASPPPAIVNLSLQKTASAPSPIGGILASFVVGSIVTYTITRTVGVSGTFGMGTTLIDNQVDGLDILPHTITVNGETRSDIYDPDTGQIAVTTFESISASNTLVLSYQAQVTTVANGLSSLTNSVTTTVDVGGTVRSAADEATISLAQRLFLPRIGNK